MTLAQDRPQRTVTPHPPRLRRYLLATYVLFIVYVSLTPFSDWQDMGLSFRDVLTAPLLQTYTWFDAAINVLAYMPFGLLLGLILRVRLGAGGSVVLAVAGGALLSGAMEFSQLYLPARTGSNLDLLTNVGGTLGGAVLAISIAPRNWFRHKMLYLRHALFAHGSDFGLALIALWVFAQINPSQPMLGNVFISEVARKPFLPPPPDVFNWLECIAVMLNLMMVGSLLLMLLRERRHAVIGLVFLLCAVSLIKFIAAAALLKSWALFLWLNSEAMLGIASGLLLLATALLLSPRGVRWLTLASGIGYLVLTHWLLDASAPSAAMPLYHWRLHLLNYNGLTQTVALAFPFLLLGYLWRRRDDGEHAV